MAVNITPIFSRVGNVTANGLVLMNQPLLLAAADYTGAGANNVLVFTAGIEGSYIQRIRLKAIGTNVASVMRFFMNNGSVNTTAANNTFFDEVQLPATTASNTTTTVPIDLVINFAIEPNFRIYMGLTTAVAAGWVAMPIAGDY